MTTEQDVPSKDRAARNGHTDQLWMVAHNATHGLQFSVGQPGDLLDTTVRCTLAGVFRMLAVAKLADTSRALRIRLITTFAVDLEPGERLSLNVFIARLYPTTTKPLQGMPHMYRSGWELFSNLVEGWDMTRNADQLSRGGHSSATVDAETWKHYAKMARELPSHRAIYY